MINLQKSPDQICVGHAPDEVSVFVNEVAVSGKLVLTALWGVGDPLVID